MTVNFNLLFFLCPLVFLAGFIDSIAGGGGLISLTSYMACGLPPVSALGTNKFSALVGGTIASANYIKTKNYDLSTLIPGIICALIGSFFGSECSMLINEKIFKILLLIATPAVAVLVISDKNYEKAEREESLIKRITVSMAIGLIVGFYDGFYGPGAGTFMQMGFIMFSGIGVRKASGNARMVNWASNCGSLINFIITKNVIFALAVPCAACSVIGNYIGSRLAIKHEVKIIKPMMLVVVSLLFVKILLDFIGV